MHAENSNSPIQDSDWWVRINYIYILQILKRDVHVPEFMEVDISELVDYPPRLLIYVKPTECSSSSISSPPEVQVLGLDRECSFKLPILSEKNICLFMHASE